ncbi:ABC transporter substrate-binding protein [Actinobaculum sp. 352]|uniref:heme/hemin ABC transporter substrate-binding protein n=1 Tax=Actinobaculum sp. 352 TaxID=2490946 RepID=UPI000F7E6E31|nr:ABC transporter substrate-binding protein [Actinobaculum sp. 352]RTE47820.1 hemin ABC transporter substrate-binding protein [Actinobaculum sp. 352]
MKRTTTALAACVTLLLSGCGSDTAENSPSASSSTAATASAPASGTTAETLDLPDAHSLTGLSEAEDIPDPEPIEGSYAQQLPATVTDAEGNSVTVTDTSRILALDLYGTFSRTVISLGYGENIVGRTVSSTENQLADLPVVTENGHSLNAEAILALNPTVILADRSIGPPEVIDQVKAAGIPVIILDSERSIESTGPLIQSVADALGVPQAGQALVERTEAETNSAIEQIAQWEPEEPLHIVFLYVRGTAGVFFILGEEDGATALITALGGYDVASANGITATTPANAEALLTLDPEVILVMSGGLESTGGVDGLLSRAGVSETRAGANQRIVSIPDGISLSFGPQTGDTLLAIGRVLYGVDDAG